MFTKLILGYKIKIMSDRLYILNTQNNLSTTYSEKQSIISAKRKMII